MFYKTLSDAITQGKGNERTFCCPVHDDQNASARVNVAKGVWYCHGCGAKGRVDGFYEPDPMNLLEQINDFAKEQRYYPESWLDIYDSPNDSYWRERFTKEAVVHVKDYRGGKSVLVNRNFAVAAARRDGEQA